METITLEKINVLAAKVMVLLNDMTVDAEIYTDLIEQLNKIERIVLANVSYFGTDSDKIIAVCKTLTLNLTFKVLEIAESQLVKPLYQ